MIDNIIPTTKAIFYIANDDNDNTIESILSLLLDNKKQ